jgi:hypothetical protein
VVRPLLIAAALLVPAGCGNERTPAPDVATPVDPVGTREVVLQEARVSFTAPGNWQALGEIGSRAGGVSSSRASVTVWRYPRSEPLPRTLAETRRVRDLLVDRVKQRDASFVLHESRVARRRIELRGRERIAGIPVEVRSLHLFDRGAEVVFDAYAPPEHFDRLDRTVFEPLLASVKLG